jgi:hypothetical protein
MIPGKCDRASTTSSYSFEKMFSGPYANGRGGLSRANYDVFPDGSFLILKPAARTNR